MTKLFLSVIKALTYTGPGSMENFELLEGDSMEWNEQDDQKESARIDAKKEDTRKKKETKKHVTPISPEKWNRNKKAGQMGKKPGKSSDSQQHNDSSISRSLSHNEEKIKRLFNMPKNTDTSIREFNVGRKTAAFIVYIDGMADKQTIDNFILRPLMQHDEFSDMQAENLIDYALRNIITVHSIIKAKDFETVSGQLLNGLTALFIDGCDECLIIESRGYEKRAVEKPVTENVVKGPQEGFNENLRTNITLVRRIIRNKKLVTEIIPIGKRNHSTCAVMYMEGLANPRVIKEVLRRIRNIDTDFLLGDGMLSNFISGNSFMLFPTVLSTERPDRAASFLMDGQVVIIADGTPFADVVPVTFYHLLHTSEDTFLPWQFGTLLRYVRVLGLLSAALLPGLYVAVTTYHQTMIPTELLSSIARTRENVPFPVVMEVILMEISFELIREAGIRVPGVIGQTLGIIGAIILGQAAVAADIVSPVVIIIVSVTGLGSFSIPNYSMGFAIRIIRFAFIFLGGVAGFYGISIGLFIIGGVGTSMKSFGIPYFSPVAPKTRKNPDIVREGPAYRQKYRPDFVDPLDRRRTGEKPRSWVTRKD